ncbi:MAG: hypothetical protein R3F59_08885 [Myxococcota bacterium]
MALAWVLAYRNAGEGAWCDEARGLLSKVTEGDAHYWATRADRERERRCTGRTDHADAELARLRAAGGLGWADGVLAKMESGYIKEDLPGELEQVLAAEPWQVDRVAALWADGVSGPGRGAARKAARQALAAADASDDPPVVLAALRAHRALGDDKDAAAAEARLRQLDPAADPALTRTPADVHDPEIYAEIAACVDQGSRRRG